MPEISQLPRRLRATATRADSLPGNTKDGVLTRDELEKYKDVQVYQSNKRPGILGQMFRELFPFLDPTGRDARAARKELAQIEKLDAFIP